MKLRLVIEVEAGEVGCGKCRLLIRGSYALVCAMGWHEYAGPRVFEENLRRGPECLAAERGAEELTALSHDELKKLSDGGSNE